jgi:hypothetical protein
VVAAFEAKAARRGGIVGRTSGGSRAMDGLLAVGGLEEGGSSYVKDLSVGGKKSMSVY